MRINKFLANAGVASRRKVEEYITSGRVKVNNVVTTNLSTDIGCDDIVCIDDKCVSVATKFEYYMLNKPKGYLSTVSDDRNRKTVVSLIKTQARIYPVGRLDYDSEGLLLLTNDGDLTNKLTHPKHNISKTYVVRIDSALGEDEKEKLESGIILEGYKLHPCEITIMQHTKNFTEMQIVIYEGRNREIRKMFESVHKKVIFLKRVKIANLLLGKLNRGEYRELTDMEVSYLKNL